ncbi:tRNA (adenosine(37)-N6)-threonylcarbamoyltransferase complex dimerization subunit type 1 TsaB [Corynebacterium propinquum]|uniref:tRNA (adenosine(37)-N6)-threonylcarbamoyltransferase complex dimerization subunit type 1 TsaB n=1 Tax=Corynebacterium propinquum TaxID=43769 RepID=UPI00266FD992|nr:tRNA (adenosine(37)-N6)-threonylcarbamoyltransferase complex dimerization subunit type 1 TsaB [Corynebacterium propinquum]WKS32463.1 tRNA (adenosine(37)-N6)-threonylcarbamoyltransferase complex dimerization subunit type 1 TsaB [Corynebacterium propinquum]WKS37046.1 tRNA (adenosine(37)-N6)-threonylcarbamoyltransferase complex dimerization subunit type 1 TsaB [Corynebacterium propinquum]WKS39023.1 tRNA (adenosine(37)-N6)-threonylcarbamoyltransferase complex dimerization subunit type 1 TsaB [Cor
MSASFPSPVLTIDTSTPTLVTGVVHTLADGTVAATENTVENTRAHNELLMPTVFELLESTGTKLSELAAVVVGCGPGPFSGLRVGMATASGLGHALGIPVYGVCSHDAIAWRALHFMDTLDAAGATTGEPSGNVLVATDARRRETYWATYSGNRRVAGPDVGPAETLQPDVDRVVAHPAIAQRLPEKLQKLAAGEATPAVPSARGLVAVADFAAVPQPLTPLYLRRPDAKEPAAKPVSAALRWAEN